MEPTILITGGAGYIGSHTAFYLNQLGYKTIILDNFLHNQEFNHYWTTIIKSDFANEQILDEIFSKYNIDAVMHFAADIDISESIKNPIKFYNNNIAKTIILLNKMLSYGIKKFIFSSSCAVYGDPQCIPITEQHPTAPINPYGKSKLMIEGILKDINDANEFNFVSLRYFNAAGALPEHGLGEQHLNETHLIPLIIRSGCFNKPFTIFGNDYSTKDGTCIRDFIHAFDIAEAHFLALKHLNEVKQSDVFNLGTGIGFSVKEIVQAIENICHLKININFAKRRAGDAPVLIADPTKANTILKWKPKFSELDFMIRSAFAFEYKIKRNETLLNIEKTNENI